MTGETPLQPLGEEPLEDGLPLPDEKLEDHHIYDLIRKLGVLGAIGAVAAFGLAREHRRNKNQPDSSDTE